MCTLLLLKVYNKDIIIYVKGHYFSISVSISVGVFTLEGSLLLKPLLLNHFQGIELFGQTEAKRMFLMLMFHIGAEQFGPIRCLCIF